jgi:hypothetical protein
MKRYSFLLASRWLVLSLCAAACSNNGTLFDDVPVLTSDDADEPPIVSPPDLGDEPEPAPPEEPVEPGGGEFDGADVPLEGGIPTPALPEDEPEDGAEEQPPPAPVAPVILDVAPADGAVGITADSTITIRFSEAMDQSTTEAAYQSENLPSSAVTFEWNEDSTELTVVPLEPLAYDVGEDPELVQARRINYFVSSSATSAAGSRLSQPYEFSFSLLRQVAFTVFAVQDRELSGNFRSNDTYGAGVCGENAINMCVGDVRVNGESEQYKGFISFELSELPVSALSVSAVLGLDISSTSGNPFAGLGGLLLEHASFDAIDLEAFGADSVSELGLIAEAGAAGARVSADVSEAVLSDLSSDEMVAAGEGLSQYRLRFEDETDNDAQSDAIVSAWDTQTLDVTYLLP